MLRGRQSSSTRLSHTPPTTPRYPTRFGFVYDSPYHSAFDAVYVHAVQWSELPIVPSYPYCPRGTQAFLENVVALERHSFGDVLALERRSVRDVRRKTFKLRGRQSSSTLLLCITPTRPRGNRKSKSVWKHVPHLERSSSLRRTFVERRSRSRNTFSDRRSALQRLSEKGVVGRRCGCVGSRTLGRVGRPHLQHDPGRVNPQDATRSHFSGPIITPGRVGFRAEYTEWHRTLR